MGSNTYSQGIWKTRDSCPKNPEPSYENTRPSVHDNPGASKQVVLTPHDIPRILRVNRFLGNVGVWQECLFFGLEDPPSKKVM